MEFRKMVTITLHAKQKKRHRCIKHYFLLFNFIFTIFYYFTILSVSRKVPRIEYLIFSMYTWNE